LRHDHRHADGTPDRVTMYGGMAQPGGTARSQAFLSDAYTARLVPGADTNLWTVTVSEDGACSLTAWSDTPGRAPSSS